MADLRQVQFKPRDKLDAPKDEEEDEEEIEVEEYEED